MELDWAGMHELDLFHLRSSDKSTFTEFIFSLSCFIVVAPIIFDVTNGWN